MSTKNLGFGRGADIFKVPFEMIICEPTKNGRIDYGNIEELALSIFENGQKQPIRATKTKNENGDCYFLLRDGFRRYLAVKHIREKMKKDFPFMLVIGTGAKYTENDALYEQIISNDAKPFNMLEEGNVYTALKKQGEKEINIAKKVGKSVPHIYNCLKLAEMPKELKQYIVDDVIKPTLMIDLLKQYTNTDELIEIINENQKFKVERTETKQTAIPFNPETGEINTDKEYNLPEKPRNCKLTAKDFQITKDSDNHKSKEKDYSFIDTDTLPDNTDADELPKNLMVTLKTVENLIILKKIDNERVDFFKDLMVLISANSTPEEMIELFM
jgi:ParB/RepB/Spo0J family partition protein